MAGNRTNERKRAAEGYRLARGRKRASNGRQQLKDLTIAEVRAQAADLALRAGYASLREALDALDAGRLDGTILESELHALRFLAGHRKLLIT